MLNLLHSFGYLGLSGTIFGEIGLMMFFLPGDTLIFSAGLLANIQMFNFWTVFSIIFLTSTVAGHVGYFIGGHLNRDLLLNNRFYRINEDHLHKTEKFFEKYGFFAVMFSRFVPVVRNLISQLCGLIQYDQKKFFFSNLIASFIWPLVIVSLGFYFGKMFPNLVRYAEILMLLMAMMIAFPFFFEVGKKITKKKTKNHNQPQI